MSFLPVFIRACPAKRQSTTIDKIKRILRKNVVASRLRSGFSLSTRRASGLSNKRNSVVNNISDRRSEADEGLNSKPSAGSGASVGSTRADIQILSVPIELAKICIEDYIDDYLSAM
jgi:hypothetical protein